MVVFLLLASALPEVGGTFQVLLLLWVLGAVRVRLDFLAMLLPLHRPLLDGLMGRSGLRMILRALDLSAGFIILGQRDEGLGPLNIPRLVAVPCSIWFFLGAFVGWMLRS